LAWLRLGALEGGYLTGLMMILSTFESLPLVAVTDQRCDFAVVFVQILSMLLFAVGQRLVAMKRNR
jgi:hypothetical protein